MSQEDQPPSEFGQRSNIAREHTSRQDRPQRPIASTTTRPTNRTAKQSLRIPSAARQPAPQPHYSLARPIISQNHAQSYVEPGYHELNPRYQETQQKPLWGLAKPLPRVLRPGMRRQDEGPQGRHDLREDKQAEVEEPGDSEAIPQVGMINDQRHEAGKSRIGNEGGNAGNRGYGNQETNNTRHHRLALESNPESNDCGSPYEEKGNPMEGWKQTTNQSGSTNPFEVHGDADIGDARPQRLSDVPERPSNGEMSDPSSLQDVDLEAGEGGDWPLTKLDDETRRTLIERDAYNSWSAIRARYREPLAECLATMVAVLVGLCTSISVVTSNSTAGSYQSQNWAWGLGVMIGVYLAGGISGGHLNPAISLTLCVFRGFPFRKAVVYIAAQLLGGFFAGLIAYGIYQPAILAYDATGGDIGAGGGSTIAVDLFTGGSARAFFTSPAKFAGAGTCFGSEFVASAILSCAILALGDDSNAPPGAGMHSFIVGLVVTVLTMAFGYMSGPCLNPARDFGPRVATAVVGYGSRVFTDRNVWWIYGAWGATISGGLVGGLLYDVAIFVGGESPVNYPKGKRKKAIKKSKRRWSGFRRYVTKQMKRGVEPKET